MIKKISLLLIASALLSACNSPDTPYVNDTKWEPVFVKGTNKIPTPLGEDEKVYIAFHEQSRINGMSGDNLFNGTFKIEDGGRVYVGPIASTRRAGPNMEYESAFLKALQDTAITEYKNDQLWLLSPKGEPLMKLKRVE